MTTANQDKDSAKTTIQCVLCGSDAWESLVELGDFCVRQCQGCGLGATYPIPTQEQLIKVNKTAYNAGQMRKTYKLYKKELNQRYKTQLKQIELFKNSSGKKLLDVGCNLGFFLSTARAQGYETYGVEINEEAANYARNQIGMDVFCGSLGDASYQDRSFDVITLWDVIEHVPDPISLLHEVHRILRDDGILAIQSPNMESSMARIAGKKWRWWLTPDHLYHFTPRSMMHLLEISGFQKTDLRTWEPSKELTANLLASLIPKQLTSSGFGEKLMRGGTFLMAQFFWPLVIPLQINARKQNRGALITAYARKG